MPGTREKGTHEVNTNVTVTYPRLALPYNAVTLNAVEDVTNVCALQDDYRNSFLLLKKMMA